MKIQEYLDRAEQAAMEGAHVAVVMNYVAAAEIAYSFEAEEIVGLALDYARNLRKPADRLWVYEWSREVIKQKEIGGELERRVLSCIEEVTKNASS